MARKTFIPNWYEDKKNGIQSRKVKLSIKIALIMNIILIGLIINVSNEMKNIKRDSSSENKNIKIVEIAKKDIFIIEKYKELSDFLQKNNFSYKNVLVTKDNLEIDIEVVDYEEYIYVIKCIEKNYSIKKLTPNIKSEGNFNFKVIL